MEQRTSYAVCVNESKTLNKKHKPSNTVATHEITFNYSLHSGV